MTKNKRFNGKISLILVLFLISLVLICCTKKEEKISEEPFRIAVVTWVGHGPFYLAQDKGFFKKEGLNVIIRKIEEIGARRSALAGKKLEGIISSPDAFANAAPEGLPAVLIMKLTDSYGADGVVVKKNINSIKDLKGKTVAFPKGTPSHMFILFLLNREGLSTKDIIPQYMEAGDAGVAFIANKVDVAVTWEPWVTQAVEKGGGKVLTTSRDIPGILTDTFIIHKDVASTRQEDVKKFMRGWFSAIEYWKKYPEESNKIMANSLDVSIDDFLAMLEGDKFSDYEENLMYFGTQQEPGKYYEVFRFVSKMWFEEGIIKKTVNPEDVTDTSFLKNLYK